MKKLIAHYSTALKRNCMRQHTSPDKNVEYWKDYLFYKTVEMVFPLCLITLVPGVLYTLNKKIYLLAFLDLLAFLMLIWVGFVRWGNMEQRKFLFIFTFYFVASYLLLYIGVFGPGMLFLYASCIFGLLILSKKFAYLWSFLNVMVIILFGFVLEFNLSPISRVNEFETKEWFVIATNLIFLSFLSSLLIPKLFLGLSETFKSQKQLQKEFDAQNKEQERLLKRYIQKNEDLEQFAYVVSHDLQEPLRMVSGFMAQLEKKYKHVLDEKAQLYVHYARDGAKRMQRIILELLEYSKIGTMQGEKETVELDDVVDEYILLRRQLMEKTGATIFKDRLPTLQGYRAPIVQTFHNLLDNAIKYSIAGKAPIIGIRAIEHKNHWEFAIQDNGMGIDKEFHDRIFVIFQRLHARDQFDGTGMGLSIAKKTVENLGGKIWVRSNVDKGSTFFFTLLK
ncbi:MAG: ATP-binding protein [Sediminicola sp.]|tara:strand:+ start:11147 stop:12496 length:1350 start_codon:yes stop_codon:yes gene_type:complete